MIIIEEVNITPLLKALKKFDSFRKNSNSEQEKAGTIQAFEYCFELAWKTMKKLLHNRGQIAHSPKEVFRLAALEQLISDPEIWFDFLAKRNLTVHTYEIKQADAVINICETFSKHLHIFLTNLEIQNIHDIINKGIPN